MKRYHLIFRVDACLLNAWWVDGFVKFLISKRAVCGRDCDKIHISFPIPDGVFAWMWLSGTRENYMGLFWVFLIL